MQAMQSCCRLVAGMLVVFSLLQFDLKVQVWRTGGSAARVFSVSGGAAILGSRSATNSIHTDSNIMILFRNTVPQSRNE